MPVFPLAPGAPDHSYTSGSGYVPIIFAKKLLVVFYAMTFLTSLTNTDYEGEIKKQGDTVLIRELPDITISDHEKGDPVVYENLEPGKQTMLIDRGKKYGFNTDPIDDVQSDIDYIPQWAAHAAERMKQSIERDFLADVYTDAHASNAGAAAGAFSGNINLGTAGTPLELTSSNIVDFIVDCGLAFDELDVPVPQRKLILPNWAVALIKKSEIKDASLTGDSESILRNPQGRVGMVDRMEIFGSNNLHRTTDGSDSVTNAMFVHPMGVSFATQLILNETLPNPNAFGKLHRGLQVFGWKVTKPECVGHAYIVQG